MESNLKVKPCNYCVNYEMDEGGERRCVEDVPWYCVSIYCNSFCDGFPVFSSAKKMNLNKVLVSTF